MGKGSGDHPPQKFVNDQLFCQSCIIVFVGVSITLSGLSAGMDNGGTFPYPYFFSGFILGLILFVNLVSRYIVVNTIKKKSVTRNNILDVLSKTSCGNIVWPWSCRIGMMWCIPGCILTGLGGVNCGIEEKEKNGTSNTTVRNNCYFDIEGQHGEMYKGLAIGLVVIHVFSFVYLFLSNCPEHSVLDQIKEDPKPPRRNAAQTPAVQTPATQTTAALAPATNNAVPTISQTVASVAPAHNEVTNQAGASGGQRDIEMEVLKKQLDDRTREVERRERELAERERQIRDANDLPPPPSYNQLMAELN